jgi:hypothetical protein
MAMAMAAAVLPGPEPGLAPVVASAPVLLSAQAPQQAVGAAAWAPLPLKRTQAAAAAVRPRLAGQRQRRRDRSTGNG